MPGPPAALIQVLDGTIVVALGRVNGAAKSVGVDIFRIELDRPAVVLDGAVGVAPAVVGLGAAPMGGGVFWIELDRPVIILDGALLRIGAAAVDIGGDIYRIWRLELDRVIVILDCAGVAPLAPEGIAAADVDEDIFRIELDRTVVVLDGAVGVALVVVGNAPADVANDIFPIEPDRLIVALNHAVEHPPQQITRKAAVTKLIAQIGHEIVSSLNDRRQRGRGPVALSNGPDLVDGFHHAARLCGDKADDLLTLGLNCKSEADKTNRREQRDGGNRGPHVLPPFPSVRRSPDWARASSNHLPEGPGPCGSGDLRWALSPL